MNLQRADAGRQFADARERMRLEPQHQRMDLEAALDIQLQWPQFNQQEMIAGESADDVVAGDGSCD